jgi:hypothetical protein
MKMVVREHVLNFIIEEFGDYNPTFADVLKELGATEEELTEESIALIRKNVGA